MKIDGDSSVLPTWMGSLYSLLLITLVLAQASVKVDNFLAKKDARILTPTKNSFFNDDYVFGIKAGFNVAVAFTSYGGGLEPELDPSIGELVLEA